MEVEVYRACGLEVAVFVSVVLPLWKRVHSRSYRWCRTACGRWLCRFRCTCGRWLCWCRGVVSRVRRA